MVDKNVVRRGYDELAEAYAADRNEDGRGREVLAQFRRGLPESARVLDAGCGQGTPVLRDLSGSTTATGVDVSRAQLELAADRVPDAALAQGDMAALPFDDGAFDAVTAYHSLIHVPSDQHQAVVDEFARVLADGGQLLCSEGPAEWRGTNPDRLDTGVEMQWHIAGAEATRDQLQSAGFAIEREWEVGDSLDEGEDARWTFFAARVEG
ncbi:methyltransferase type 11 [Halorubrum sp. E3]|uniref:Methyltransferase type 11 n=1 Tax=Halorubrum persicum TaxID=1383844 RepID=A0A2G1WFH9_9EURY|nr:class I SAM-dependent methyltransferase [Halorubrum persicum]OYR52455.1 methyltransferase type 11 [Halorubrum sp. E3]PHQ37758.1 methyltransferase type 11 [Halorubrum persicum]